MTKKKYVYILHDPLEICNSKYKGFILKKDTELPGSINLSKNYIEMQRLSNNNIVFRLKYSKYKVVDEKTFISKYNNMEVDKFDKLMKIIFLIFRKIKKEKDQRYIHKYLYMIIVNYYLSGGKEIFEFELEAWKYGIVFPKVWKILKGRKLWNKSKLSVLFKELKTLNKIYKYYFDDELLLSTITYIWKKYNSYDIKYLYNINNSSTHYWSNSYVSSRNAKINFEDVICKESEF